ncbi:MAG: hypothetical protein KJ638_13140, partial [Chloroflexi bacterium]|nr:hypothetical protein [Chloroflexota bacterium]
PHLGGEIVISALNNEQYLPSVAYNSNHDEYLVIWYNMWGVNRDIYAQRITGQGELLSWFAVGPTAPLNPYPNDRIAPSVAYDPVNDRYLVVWAYDTPGDGSNWDIHGVFVNWDGPIQGLHQLNISDWPTQQWTPKVAYARAEEEFMIVWWTDHPSVPGYISGRRMTASDGTFPSSGSDFTISHPSEVRVNPEISYNLARNEYLVVYDNMQDVFGTRFTGTGIPLAGGEFGIAGWPGAETQPSVAACRETDQYLVAWQNDQPDIYARFIKGDGSLDGGPLNLESTSVAEIQSQVACNSAGNQFLVVWQQQFSSATGPYGIWGQFVNTDKTLGADFGIMTPTSGVTAEFTTPVVAGGNVNYLTVWEHDRAGTAFQDIHGRLITPYTVFLPLMLRNHQ